MEEITPSLSPVLPYRAALSVALCGALFGCASYTPQPITPHATVQSFEARTLDNPELLSYVAAHQGGRGVTTWQLESLTLAAYYFSPELDVARARSATADAAVETASQQPNPTLQLPFVYTSNAKSGESPYTLGLGLDIPIETAGKRGYRTAQARQLSIAAQFEVGAAAWQVRSRLRTQLLEAFVGQRRIGLLAQQLQLRQQILGLLDKRLALGAASAPEAQLARAALAQGRLELAKAEQQVQDALAGAAATIGLPLASIRNADIRLDAFGSAAAESSTQSLRVQALQNRADVQTALASYEATQAALQLEVANQYPDIHLGLGYAYDLGARKFALALSSIQLPLFNRNQGPIAEAEARRKEAAARFNAVQAQAIGHADQADQRYRAAEEALHLSDSLSASRQQQLAAARKTFAVGATDRLSLSLAELDEGSAQLAHEDTLARVQGALGEIEDAMQRPLNFPVGPGR